MYAETMAAKVPLNFSISPCCCGVYGADNVGVMFIRCITSKYASAANIGALSLSRRRQGPTTMNSSVRAATTVDIRASGMALVYIHLLKYSPQTRMYLLPLGDIGNFPDRSMQ